MSGAFDKVKGEIEEKVGEAKAKLGDITDNRDLHADGLKDQVKGGATQAKGHIKDATDGQN